MKVNTYMIYTFAFIITSFFLLTIWLFSVPERNTLEYELCKMLIQLLVFLIVGGGVKHAVDQYAKEKESRASKMADLREMQQKLADSYAKVKRVRRELRVDFAKPEFIVRFTDYRQRISELIDIQLELELLNVDVKVSSVREISNVSDSVKKMEEYLKTIIAGFRKAVRKFDQIPETIKLEELSGPEKDFISEEKENPWYTLYVKPLRSAREDIRRVALSFDIADQ